MKRRLILTSVISIFLIVILFIESTYSIFTSSTIDEDLNVYKTGNLDISYTISEDSVTLTSKLPVAADKVMTVRPYQITVTNIGNVAYKFNLKLTDTTATNKIDSQYIMTKVGQFEPKSLNECTDNVIKEGIVVPANDQAIIDIRVYLSEDIKNSEIGKSFYAKLSIEGLAIYNENNDIDNSMLQAPSAIAVIFDSGNLLYDLSDKASTESEYMTYSISDGIITVTGNTEDGYGFTTGRVYLEAGKEYTFSADTNKTWGTANSAGDGTVQAFLMLDGLYNNWYHMDSNNNYTFTPTITGTYWLRLDVNKTGKTATFSNIKVKELSSSELTYGNEYGEMPIPTREGYTFNGWYTAESGGTQITSSTIVTSTSNQTLYAQWSINSYTITFYANGGSITTTSKTVTYGSTYGDLPTPTYSGYIFNGWFTLSSGGTQVTSSSAVKITDNQTLYAQWTQDTAGPTYTSYNITNVTNSGYDIYVYGVSDLSGVNRVQFPTWTSYNGQDDLDYSWSTSSGVAGTNQGNGTWYFRVNTTDHNGECGEYVTHIYLYDSIGNSSVIAPNATTVPGITVTIAVNNSSYGSVSASSVSVGYGATYTSSGSTMTFPGGQTVTATANSATGYSTSLASWSPSSGTITKAATITANFSRSANTYTVSFNANGGTVGIASKTVTYGGTYGELPTPSKSGYVFIGWFDSSVAIYDSSKLYKDYPMLYYADYYSDLYSAFGYNQVQLRSHYVNAGASEGRRTSQYISTDTVSITNNITLYAGWYTTFTSQSFGYTGGVQTFTVPATGTYKLEVWGAQGGTINSSYENGGLGGYSYGNVLLTAGQTLHVVIGGKGGASAGGYNGGGSGYDAIGGGGGATHIATATGVLSALSSNKSSVLIVAGGGGAGRYDWSTYAIYSGGSGGGTTGGNGVNASYGNSLATGGTQSAGGADSAGNTYSGFGYGSSGQNSYEYPGGGGGGYYGGGGGHTQFYHSAAGGSGYIGGVTGGSMQNGVQSGNGYATITFVS